MGDQDNSENASNQSTSSRNLRFYDERYPDTSYENPNIGLNSFADPQSSFSSTADPMSDEPVQTVRRVYATGGFLDTSSEDRRFERPLIAFEQGEKYSYDDNIGVAAKQDNREKVLRERARYQGRVNNRGNRPMNAPSTTLIDQDDSNMSQDPPRNLFDGVSSGDEPADEEDNEEKERKKRKIRERKYHALLNREIMDPMDLDELDYEDEQLSEKEELDMEMRIQRRRDELRAHVGYVKKLKDKRALLAIIEPLGEKAVKPIVDAQQIISKFNVKNEAQLLEKVSGPPSFILSNLADLIMKYEKNKRIQNEKRELRDSIRNCEEEQEMYFAKVLSNMEMRAATETAISATLDHDKNVLELLQTGEEKEQLEDDYKRKLELLEELKRRTCKIQSLCDNKTNSEDFPLSENMDAREFNSSQDRMREWPSALPTREKRITSREISTFLLRSKGDAYESWDPKGSRLLEKVLKFNDNKRLDTNDSSIIVDFNEKEAELKSRDAQCLRPVLIDGCGAAYAYDKEFAPLFSGPTKFSPYLRQRVLPVYPLATLALRMTLMGYKIIIILPKYYEEPYFKAQKRLKVDNLYAFQKLVDAKLISFWDPVEEEDNIMDMMKDKAQELGAAIITDSHVEATYAYRKRQKGDDNTNDDFIYDLAEQLMDDNQADEYQKMMKIEKLRGNCADRVLSVCFQTNRKDLFITREFHDVVEVGEVDHARRKYNYYRIGENITFLYSELDGDVRDEGIRLRNQLMLKDQAERVLTLCQLYELTKVHLWACMIFLSFVQKQGIIPEQMDEFVEDNVHFVAPNSHVVTLASQNLAETEAKNSDLREYLKKQELSWKQKLKMFKEEKARCKFLTTQLGFLNDFSEEEDGNKEAAVNLHKLSTDT